MTARERDGEIMESAKALRRQMAETAADIDRTGRDPDDNMRAIHAAGLTRLLLPETYGGIASAQALAADLPLVTDVLTELSAGESATAQIWSIHLVAARLIFGGALVVGEDVRQEIAGEMLDGGIRLANSAAEGGKRRGEYNTLAEPVDGGYRLSGVKLFNTGTVGAKYTITPVKIRGREDAGVVYLLVRMDADGVKPHNDWDNMGQRATGSGTITFENVFVPERFFFPMTAGPDGMTGAASVIGPFFQLRSARRSSAWASAPSTPWPPSCATTPGPTCRRSTAPARIPSTAGTSARPRPRSPRPARCSARPAAWSRLPSTAAPIAAIVRST